MTVCNNKQPWNEDKCRCECKELIGKARRDKGFICITVIMNDSVISYVMLGSI